MQENKFDKQVRQAMDDLKLKPSATVWTNVESQIREKRRRRRAFIILPVLLGIALIGYFGQDYLIGNTPAEERDGKILEKKPTISDDNKTVPETETSGTVNYDIEAAKETQQEKLTAGKSTTESSRKKISAVKKNRNLDGDASIIISDKKTGNVRPNASGRITKTEERIDTRETIIETNDKTGEP
jgi:hypothetical protein